MLTDRQQYLMHGILVYQFPNIFLINLHVLEIEYWNLGRDLISSHVLTDNRVEALYIYIYIYIIHNYMLYTANLIPQNGYVTCLDVQLTKQLEQLRLIV